MDVKRAPKQHLRKILPPSFVILLSFQLALSAQPVSPVPSPVGPKAAVKSTGLTTDKQTKGKKRASRKVSKKNTVDESAVVESVRQKVEIQSAGEAAWRKAKEKTSIKYSDQIRTGSRSVARLKLGDGSKILLLQNSQAEFENLSSLERTIKLLRGRVRAVVNRLKGQNTFKVKTPVGVASVRGTDFTVEFIEEEGDMVVDVASGQVGVSKLGDLAEEVILNAGERIKFGIEGEMGDPIRSGALPLDRTDVRIEVQDSKVKDTVAAMAADELKNADYEQGKTLVDSFGETVRVTSYINRPADNQFKLVVLNERPKRFDYFTYTGTFNTTLPSDLSVALKQIRGKLGVTAPDYYLTAYETDTSNTVDHIRESATGGHLAKIFFDGTKYTLTDPSDPSNSRTIEAAALQSDGNYKIYNPDSDTFSVVTAAQKDEALKISVLDSVSGSYRNLGPDDTLWKTRFNSLTSSVNSVTKTAYARKTGITNMLAVDLDASFTNAPIVTLNEFPSGTGLLHNRLSLFYGDGTKLVYNNKIVDDEGKLAEADKFAGVSTSEAYKNELEKWNFEMVVTADEMNGRDIRLSVGSKIATQSGLAQ